MDTNKAIQKIYQLMCNGRLFEETDTCYLTCRTDYDKNPTVVDRPGKKQELEMHVGMWTHSLLSYVPSIQDGGVDKYPGLFTIADNTFNAYCGQDIINLFIDNLVTTNSMMMQLVIFCHKMHYFINVKDLPHGNDNGEMPTQTMVRQALIYAIKKVGFQDQPGGVTQVAKTLTRKYLGGINMDGKTDDWLHKRLTQHNLLVNDTGKDYFGRWTAPGETGEACFTERMVHGTVKQPPARDKVDYIALRRFSDIEPFPFNDYRYLYLVGIIQTQPIIEGYMLCDGKLPSHYLALLGGKHNTPEIPLMMTRAQDLPILAQWCVETAQTYPHLRYTDYTNGALPSANVGDPKTPVPVVDDSEDSVEVKKDSGAVAVNGLGTFDTNTVLVACEVMLELSNAMAGLVAEFNHVLVSSGFDKYVEFRLYGGPFTPGSGFTITAAAGDKDSMVLVDVAFEITKEAILFPATVVFSNGRSAGETYTRNSIEDIVSVISDMYHLDTFVAQMQSEAGLAYMPGSPLEYLVQYFDVVEKPTTNYTTLSDVVLIGLDRADAVSKDIDNVTEIFYTNFPESIRGCILFDTSWSDEDECVNINMHTTYVAVNFQVTKYLLSRHPLLVVNDLMSVLYDNLPLDSIPTTDIDIAAFVTYVMCKLKQTHLMLGEFFNQ